MIYVHMCAHAVKMLYFRHRQSHPDETERASLHWRQLHLWPPLHSLMRAASERLTPLSSATGPAGTAAPSPLSYVLSSSSSHTQASRSRWLVGSSRSSMKGRIKRALVDAKGNKGVLSATWTGQLSCHSAGQANLVSTSEEGRAPFRGSKVRLHQR